MDTWLAAIHDRSLSRNPCKIDRRSSAEGYQAAHLASLKASRRRAEPALGPTLLWVGKRFEEGLTSEGQELTKHMHADVGGLWLGVGRDVSLNSPPHSWRGVAESRLTLGNREAGEALNNYANHESNG